MSLRVVPHDDRWAALFADEAQRLREALAEVLVQVHHIGSTAVPGLDAKPVIDVLLEVSGLAALELRASHLSRLGYEPKGEFGIPGRRYFRRDDAVGIRTHQVHAYELGSAQVMRHLAFRDYLRAHADVAREYGALKRQLAARFAEDSAAYVDGKAPLVRRIEAAALAWADGRAGADT